MKFDFFTFGGALFWEDVFFYQKWRIQRNCITKTYRLLDSWDIKRARGSFEYCQKEFIKKIECYEITKQQGHMVILLHGYMNGKNIFKNLWRKLVLTHSTVAALNYPSLFRDSVASAHQILFFLNHIEDITDVSFVTKGAGNLVLRQLFNLPLEMQSYRDTIRIRNIVSINPVEKNSLVCDFFSKFRIFRLIFGPMLSEMTEGRLKHVPSLPKQINNLKIFSKSRIRIFMSKGFKIFNFNIEKNKSDKKDTLFLEGTALNPLNDEKILNYTVKFIKNGKI